MNINRSTIFWGILLIGAGLLALADQMGYADRFSPLIWSAVFAAVSLLAFLSYALSGWKLWGWLFPAGIFGGLALTTLLATSWANHAAAASPLFFGLLIPFAAAYLNDRVHNWWALIPGGVMLFLALTTLVADSTGGRWIGALLLFMIAVSFLVVYLSDRTRIWAAIVAYATAVVGLAPLMAEGGNSAPYFAPIFLLAIALPFFYVYFRSMERWWAILPAGILTVIALITTLGISGFIRSETEGAYVNALFMAGLAVPFAVIWLRHARAWARIVTIVLGALGIASAFFGSSTQIYWPILFVLVGIYLLYTGFRPKQA